MATTDLPPGPAPGTLYVIATPIGNLDDISARALQCLRSARCVACEDTRHTARLCRRHRIETPRVSLHSHNEAQRSESLLARLAAGEDIALVSDAGMPGVSDPGQRLIHRCRREGIPCDVIPGPSAVVTALTGSGFPADRFFFGGFLPNKSGGRLRELRGALEREETCVFFESPHRIGKTLAALAELDPERPVCVARELTKIHQEYLCGPPGEIALTRERWKGEITLVIAGNRLPAWMRA